MPVMDQLLSSTHRSGWGEPGTVAPNPQSSIALAAPPGRSLPSGQRQSSVSSSSSFAPSTMTEQPLSQLSPWSQNRGPLQAAPVPTLDSNRATRFQPREKIAIADT